MVLFGELAGVEILVERLERAPDRVALERRALGLGFRERRAAAAAQRPEQEAERRESREQREAGRRGAPGDTHGAVRRRPSAIGSPAAIENASRWR